ncbi:MAG: tetratricopeptide repeat protein [Myxococcales bacterium]|nr:tetratricopeptide repeat protein [Myxococcales bacterium]
MSVRCPFCRAEMEPSINDDWSTTSTNVVCSTCGKSYSPDADSLPEFEFDLEREAGSFVSKAGGDNASMSAAGLDVDPFGDDSLFDQLEAEGSALTAAPIALGSTAEPSRFDFAAEDSMGSFGGPGDASIAPVSRVSKPRPMTGSPPADEDFSGTRKELSGLTEMDLSVIGTYRRNQDHIVQAEEVIWTPKGGAGSGPESARGLSDTNTGRPARPKSKVDPGVGRRQGSTAVESPFEVQPIGNDLKTSKRPAPPPPPPPKKSGAPPRQQTSPPSSPRKAGTPPAAPVTNPGLDPFASLFAEGTNPGVEGNPFDVMETSAPGSRQSEKREKSSPGAAEFDFSALMDNTGTNISQLGAERTDPAIKNKSKGKGKGQPPPSAAGTEDPFSFREDTNTFFVDTPSSSAQKAGKKEAGKGRGTNPGVNPSDGFELDMPAPSATEFADLLPTEATSQDGRHRSERGKRKNRPNKATLRQRLPKVGLGTRIFASIVLLTLGVGLGLGQTSLGYFGLNYFFPAAPPKELDLKKEVAKIASRQDGAAREDTAAAYRNHIERLETELQKNPDSRQTKQDLLEAYLEFRSRFPDEFKAAEKYVKRKEALSKEVDIQSIPRLLALELIQDGKFDEAEIALKRALQDAEILFLYGQIAFEKAEWEKSKEYLEQAAKLNPHLVKAKYFLGQIAEKTGNFDDAKKWYDDVLAQNRIHSDARLGSARMLLVQREFAEAERIAADVLRIAKSDMNTQAQFEAHKTLAQIYAQQNNLEKRLSHLQSAIQFRPGDELLVLELVDQYVVANRTEDAEKLLNGCLKSGCKSGEFYTRLVRFYVESQKMEEAEKFAEEAAKLYPEDPSLMFLKGEIAEKRGHAKNARSIYQALLQKDPTYAMAYSRIADIHTTERRYEDATTTLLKGIEVNPDSVQLLRQLADLYVATSQLIKAKDMYDRLVDKDSKTPETRFEYAKLLSELGYADEAVKQFELLYSSGYTDSDVALAFAGALTKAQRPRDAINELEKLLRKDPQHVEANTRMGELQIELKSFKTAEMFLKAALRVDPGFAQAFFALGRLELAQNNLNDAITYLDKAVGFSGANMVYRAELAKALTQKGTVDDRRRALDQYDTIIKHYKTLTGPELATRDPDVYMRRAQLYFDSAKYREALQDFEMAMLMDTSRVEAIASFAETLFKMKRERDAKSYFEEILKRDANHAKAHYYLGQIALNQGDRRAAENHLMAAVHRGGGHYPDAHKTLGFIFREKGLGAPARREFELYLKTADAGAYDRAEVERIISRIRR